MRSSTTSVFEKPFKVDNPKPIKASTLSSDKKSNNAAQQTKTPRTVPNNNKDIQDFYRSWLSRTTAAGSGNETSIPTSNKKKKSQSVKGHTKKTIEPSVSVISLPKPNATSSQVTVSSSNSSSSTGSNSSTDSVSTHSTDIQNFFRSLLSQTTAAGGGTKTSTPTSKKKKSQTVKGHTKKTIEPSVSVISSPKPISSVEVSLSSVVVSPATVASSESDPPVLQSSGSVMTTIPTASLGNSSAVEQRVLSPTTDSKADVEVAVTSVMVTPVPQPTLPTSPGGPSFFANSVTPTSPAAKPDAKAQSLLKELYALVDEVCPANDSAVAKQRGDYLTKLKPYQDHQATLTVADRGKLRTLQGELEEAQAAVAGASFG